MPDEKMNIAANLWVTAPLDLEPFCVRLQHALNLPEFDFDAENVWEWGLARIENGTVAVNVSRMHDDGDPILGAPLRIMLLVSEDADVSWKQEARVKLFVSECGQAIADVANSDTYSGEAHYLGGNDFRFEPKQIFRSELSK